MSTDPTRHGLFSSRTTPELRCLDCGMTFGDSIGRLIMVTCQDYAAGRSTV